MSNHEDSDDVLQETFLKAYNKLHTFRYDSSMYTWLYRIAINLSINELRKRKIRSVIPVDDLYESLKSSVSTLPDKIVEADEAARRIEEAKNRLPAKQKAVFVMRYYDQLSNKEIAQITGNSEGTVKANYFFALAKIKDYLRDG